MGAALLLDVTGALLDVVTAALLEDSTATLELDDRNALVESTPLVAALLEDRLLEDTSVPDVAALLEPTPLVAALLEETATPDVAAPLESTPLVAALLEETAIPDVAPLLDGRARELLTQDEPDSALLAAPEDELLPVLPESSSSPLPGTQAPPSSSDAPRNQDVAVLCQAILMTFSQ